VRKFLRQPGKFLSR